MKINKSMFFGILITISTDLFTSTHQQQRLVFSSSGSASINLNPVPPLPLQESKNLPHPVSTSSLPSDARFSPRDDSQQPRSAQSSSSLHDELLLRIERLEKRMAEINRFIEGQIIENLGVQRRYRNCELQLEALFKALNL